MNSNLKFIFFLSKQTWKYIWQFPFFLNYYHYFIYFTSFGFSESSGGWSTTSEAFIFSLNNNEGLEPFVSKVRKEYSGTAIYRVAHFGPMFGNYVYIVDNADSNSNSRARLGIDYSVPPAVQDKYTVLAGTVRFFPDEVEVFYLDPFH